MHDSRVRIPMAVLAAALVVGAVAASPGRLRAQPVLTLDAAVAEALGANWSVLRAANQVGIARNNVSPGAAGFLPRLDLAAGYNGALTSSAQQLSSGETIERSGASSSTGNAGITATWTVFDGFRMFRRMDQLKLERDAAELDLETARQALRRRVNDAYYLVVVNARRLGIADSALALSLERVRLAELKHDAGQFSKRELLQARVDVNADRSARLRQEVELRNARTALNLLLARPLETEFRVEDVLQPRPELAYQSLVDSALAFNVELRGLRLARDIAGVDRAVVDADRYPRVGLSLGYALQQTRNQASLIASNRTAGPNYGVTLSMNLYDGLNTNRAAENASLAVAGAELAYNDAAAQLRSALRSAYDRYSNRLALVALERENVAIARENLDVALERFRAGSIIALELREAQNGFVEAEGRLSTALYEVKLGEAELLYAAGLLR